GVAANHAEDVLEHGLLDDLVGPMQSDVAGITGDGRNPEHRDPPQRRELPRAPRPERPAREGAEPRVELERASIGGARREDAEREVEIAGIDGPRPGLGRAGCLAPERPEERRQGNLAGGAVELA